MDKEQDLAPRLDPAPIERGPTSIGHGTDHSHSWIIDAHRSGGVCRNHQNEFFAVMQREQVACERLEASGFTPNWDDY